MDERAQDTIKKHFNKLPQDIQDAILAADLPEKFKTIANKHKLTIGQAFTLENETMFVMLGLENQEGYTNNLKQEADISQEEAEKIAEEVGRMIFLPIRVSLRKLHEVSKETEAVETEHIPADREGPQKIEHQLLAERNQESGIRNQEKTTGTSVSTTALNKDIFREKLDKPVHFAKEETVVQVSDRQTSPPVTPKPPSVDPYRESVGEEDMAGIKQEGIVGGNQESRIRNKELKKGETTMDKPAIQSTPTVSPSKTTVKPTPLETAQLQPKGLSPQSMLQKPEIPEQRTGIINMPGAARKEEEAVPAPQNPRADVNKSPAFAAEKMPPQKPSSPPQQKIVPQTHDSTRSQEAARVDGAAESPPASPDPSTGLGASKAPLDEYRGSRERDKKLLSTSIGDLESGTSKPTGQSQQTFSKDLKKEVAPELEKLALKDAGRQQSVPKVPAKEVPEVTISQNRLTKEVSPAKRQALGDITTSAQSPATTVSAPPNNLPQKEGAAAAQPPKLNADVEKKEEKKPPTDPYREPIE